jgi:hypothetical protein
MVAKYIREIGYLRLYIAIILITIGASYSVYYFCKPETVANLGDEDHFFEWWTATSLFIASAFCLNLFIRTRNIFFILLFLLFIFGGGEEISWGQRIFGFKTPEIINEVNVQKEFSFHNIEIFNTADFKGYTKHGIARLLEVNFLFRLFMITYGIVIPFLVYHFKLIRQITERFKLPVPPIGIGIFFIINWLVFRLIHNQIISAPYGLKYIGANPEIFECVSAYILMIITIYFYVDRRKIVYGRDIKNYLFEKH